MNKFLRSKSKTFLTFCFSFILGSSASALHSFQKGPLFLASCVALSVVILLWEKTKMRFLSIMLFILFFSEFRTSLTIPDCTNKSNICFYNGSKIETSGYIDSEPNEKVGSTEYFVKVNDGRSGRLLVKVKPYPKFNYGDELKIRCTLKTPEPIESFHYEKYLARNGVWSVCGDPLVEKVGEGQGSRLAFAVLQMKSSVSNKVRLFWPEPEASLMAGILYGGRSGLPSDLVQNFSRTGVSHIVAVSGFNITIIIMVVLNILIFAGLRRQSAFYAVLFFTVLFVFFSGLSASAVRAALMGSMLLVARQIGRGSSQLNSIVFAAALMQFFNPYLMLWDVGFQLSFLATIGLAVLNPKLDSLVSFGPAVIRETLTSTLSAIVMTFPLILYQFGTFSFVAPLVNLLILWIVPYLMLLGTLAITFFFIPPLAAFFAYLAHLGLLYVIMVVQYFGSKTWASATMKTPFLAMVLMYAVIVFVLNNKKVILWAKEKLK